MSLLVNNGWAVAKGGLGNFMPSAGVDRLAGVLSSGRKKYGRIVGHAELKKNDYSVFPNRCFRTEKAGTYRRLPEIVAEEGTVEADAKETDKTLQGTLEKIGE